MPRLSWSNRVGLTLAVPCPVLAFVLAGQAVWDARPLPTCLASGLDPLNPAQRCRRVTMLGGVPVTAGATNSSLKMVEQGTVSGVPDLRAAGNAALTALALYLASCGFGWVLRRWVRPASG
jgi:hypothetical protein